MAGVARDAFPTYMPPIAIGDSQTMRFAAATGFFIRFE
jgi:hypothetical protein